MGHLAGHPIQTKCDRRAASLASHNTTESKPIWGKHFAGQLHVKCIFEVDLEEAKSGTLVGVEGVAE